MAENVLLYKLDPATARAYPDQQSVGVSHNRNINAASSTYAAATNSATWNISLGIRELTISPLSKQVVTVATDTKWGCLVVYNAPNDAVAAAWLADAGSATSDVAYDIITDGSTITRQFVDAVTRVDVLPIGTNNATMRVVIGAN